MLFSKKKWEDICLRCGLCCYEKTIDEDDNIFIDFDSPCQYLDRDKNMCTVYENRFELCSECTKLTLYHALFVDYLPPSCGYVRHFKGIRSLIKKLRFWE